MTGVLASACLTPPPGADPNDASADDAATFDAATVDGPTDGGADATSDAAWDASSCADTDGDGYLRAGCASAHPPDCMEGVPGVHPGAYDDPATSDDEDCSGTPLQLADALVPNTTSQPTGTTVAITNAHLVATFDRALGGAITSLTSPSLGTGNLLHTGMGTLDDERFVGVHIWRSWFSWRTNVQPAIIEEVSNRAAWRGRVTWAAGDGSTLTGVSRYTVFPDGRIHVNHEITVTGSPTETYLTAYMAVDPDAFTYVDSTISAAGPIDRTTFDGTLLNWFDTPSVQPTGHSCAYNPSNNLLAGMAWRMAGDTHGPRVTESRLDGTDASHELGFVYDLRSGVPPEAGAYRATLMLLLGASEDPTACAPMARHAQPFVLPSSLTMTTGELVTDTAGDTDTDGYVEAGGFYHVNATGGGQLDFTVNTLGDTRFAPSRSSAFLVDGLSATRDPVVYVGSTRLEHGRDYLLDGAGTQRWLFLAVPLAGGSRVRLETP